MKTEITEQERQAIIGTLRSELKMNYQLSGDIADAILTRLNSFQKLNISVDFEEKNSKNFTTTEKERESLHEAERNYRIDVMRKKFAEKEEIIFEKDLYEAFLSGAEALSELRKPSEELERGITITKVPIEDLVQEIELAICINIDGEGKSFDEQVCKASKEIAKLIPSSPSQENDVNVELLEALKRLQEWNKKYPPGRIYDYGRAKQIESELTEIVKAQALAITNYEKQINYE